MNPLKSVVNKLKKTLNKIDNLNSFDMSSKDAREQQVKIDFELAKNQRAETVEKWKRLDEYYNNKHYTKQQVLELCERNGWNFAPPVLPDPLIQVESQIDSNIPQCEFIGRDDDRDSIKAKEREAVVNYIVYSNNVKKQNIENERSRLKYGDAFFKVAFDGSIKGFGFVGDIVIGNPSVANMFPDPSAYCLDDCEYIIYAYRMHRRKARRTFGKVLDELGNDGLYRDTEIFERDAERNFADETVQVVEYWYRDDEGDIACSIQIDFTEVKFIPKYWVNTRSSGNQLFPFVHYAHIPIEQSFWNKGDIETIVDLVDAADREFLSSLLADMMQPADIIVYEEGALADGEVIEAAPNAKLKVRDNKVNAVRRLGGLGSNINAINMIEFIHSKIEETTGNSVSSNGVEPTKVTTASGIAQLNERADARKSIKKADRNAGFERLYELIDWTALEFYNTDRVILIRGQKETEDGVFNDSFIFNSENHKTERINPATKQPEYYYPKVDCEIVAGDGINKSKAFTLQATQELANTPITPQNAKIVKSEIDILDLPNKNEIKDAIDQSLQPPQSQGVQGLSEQELQSLSMLSPEQQAQVFQELGIDPKSMNGGMM